MKTLSMILVLFGILSTNYVKADVENIYPVRLCGTIYRFNESGQSSADNVVRIISIDSDKSIRFDSNLIAGNANVQKTLDRVRSPNDAYLGCVHGFQLPEQGVEGFFFIVEEIELRGQTTGVSAGR